jgi:hypothetical protein
MAEKYSKDMTPEEKAARRKERMDELQTQREAGALQRSLARAASDSKYNFTQRPEGFIDEGNKVIRYYGWSGGKETGSWVAREAPLTEVNYNKYKNLIPATEIPVTSIKSKMIPNKDVKDGFVIDTTGAIVAKGNVDKSVLGIKSDLDMGKVLGKRTDRETAALTAALERAQKSPLTNFMQRPDGRVTSDKIYFYNWIGGKDTGQWYLYEAEKTQENLDKYATKIPGQTYFKPTSIRDTLIPVTNVFGENWNTVKSKKKVVAEFNPANVAKITLTGQIER